MDFMEISLKNPSKEGWARLKEAKVDTIQEKVQNLSMVFQPIWQITDTEPETARETYRRADQAVYYCKNNGRDQVKVAKSPLRLLTQHAETKVIYDADTLGQTFGTQLAPQKAEVAERNEGQ